MTFSITIINRHDIAEILLKVALKTLTLTLSIINISFLNVVSNFQSINSLPVNTILNHGQECIHTDGSATNAIVQWKEGLVFSIPNGEQQSEAIPTGLHCSNYKAEEEAIIHAAHTIKCKVDNNTQVVFLTDALSVLQDLMNDNPYYLSLNKRYTPSKPLEQCYSGSLLIVEFVVMNKLTD